MDPELLSITTAIQLFFYLFLILIIFLGAEEIPPRGGE